MSEGNASVAIQRAPNEVWAAIADITRMGEWSPECVAGRWVGGATGPAVGARFEGDNAMKVGGRTLKRWTTTSEVTGSDPGKLFEFRAEGLTTWRYELRPEGTGTRVTESFRYEMKGLSGVVAGLIRRSAGMTKGMQRTLDRLKAGLESSAPV